MFILPKYPLENPVPRIINRKRGFKAGLSLFITLFKFIKRIKWHTQNTKNFENFNTRIKEL